MKLLLQTTCGENHDLFCDMVPSEVLIDSSSSKDITASIKKTSTEFRGEVSIRATLSGASAGEYAVVYKNGKSAVNVIGSDVSPPAPAMSSAYFSNDGRAVYVVFDSETNQASTVITAKKFQCSVLFNFTRANNAQCSWVSSNTIIFYSATINIGNEVFLLPNILKAKCGKVDASGSDCNLYINSAQSDPVS